MLLLLLLMHCADGEEGEDGGWDDPHGWQRGCTFNESFLSFHVVLCSV